MTADLSDAELASAAGLTAAQLADYRRAEQIRRRQEAAGEREQADLLAARRMAAEDAADARMLAYRAAGLPPPTGAEVRAELAELGDLDGEIAAAEQRLTQLKRHRAAVTRRQQEAARVEAFAQVAATRSAGVLDSHRLRTYPLRIPGLSVADGLLAELSGDGPVTPLAEAVRAMLPAGTVTRRSVTEALRTAGLDPQTGMTRGKWSA